MKRKTTAKQPIIVDFHNNVENHIHVSINELFWILVDFVFFFLVAISLGSAILKSDWWMVALDGVLMAIIVWRRSS